MSAMKRAAIYVRVSTNSQTTDNQEKALREMAANAGWEVVEVYRDKGVSGAKGRDERPALREMHKAATQRRFDVVMAWSVDRLGRSLQDLVGFLGELHALDVDLVLHQQGLDTTTPSGRAMFQMMGVFAEFERAMIRDRVKAGLDRRLGHGFNRIDARRHTEQVDAPQFPDLPGSAPHFGSLPRTYHQRWLFAEPSHTCR